MFQPRLVNRNQSAQVTETVQLTATVFYGVTNLPEANLMTGAIKAAAGTFFLRNLFCFRK